MTEIYAALSDWRFTPTCVGNTSWPPVLLPVSSVHPHMRGEYEIESEEFATTAGSPPHAWGIRQAPHRDAITQRFTPTCVGNTWLRLFSLM